jgi:hypothetical protein
MLLKLFRTGRASSAVSFDLPKLLYNGFGWRTMKRFAFAFLILAIAGITNGQFLRAGARAQVVSIDGNDSITSESAWAMHGFGTVVSETATASAGANLADTFFSAEFGRLRGKTYARSSGTGGATVGSFGTFSSINNFVGAGFFDTLTLTGEVPVSLRINYSFHSINTLSAMNADATTVFKLDTFSTSLGNQNIPAITHNGAGERTDSGSFIINGVAGNTFDLLAEMSSFSSSFLASSQTGTFTAVSDELNTGLITIDVISGSFSSASGSTYSAPVPEPASLAVLGLGGLLLSRRRGRRTR